MGDLAKATGIPRQRVDDALKALVTRNEAFARGKVAPPGGGKPATRYVSTSSLLSPGPSEGDAG